jgi:hypothetical protein
MTTYAFFNLLIVSQDTLADRGDFDLFQGRQMLLQWSHNQNPGFPLALASHHLLPFRQLWRHLISKDLND